MQSPFQKRFGSSFESVTSSERRSEFGSGFALLCLFAKDSDSASLTGSASESGLVTASSIALQSQTNSQIASTSGFASPTLIAYQFGFQSLKRTASLRATA